MKEKLVREVQHGMVGVLDQQQQEMLKLVLIRCFNNYIVKEELIKNEAYNSLKFLEMFLAAKSVEGCSNKTIEYYSATIKKLLNSNPKDVRDYTTEDIRNYLSEYQNSSKVTMDNMRRIFSSFFSWLEDEDHIVKSPVRRIHKVKTSNVIKETFTDENLEVLSDACTEIRNLAIIELLASAGIRVGELVLLNKSDVNFNERSCIVLGKGNKEREVYFDAKTKLHLKAYLESRKDNNPALIVTLNAPYTRLTINGVEKTLRKIGKMTNINRVYPHKFRRTLATMAIDKGMPIEQVQNLLGHKNINTTMHYAMVNTVNVKNSHRKIIA